jgi:arginase family enzyme
MQVGEDGAGVAEDRLRLRELLANDATRGLDITVFDPELDADGTLAELLAATLRDALTRA